MNGNIIQVGFPAIRFNLISRMNENGGCINLKKTL